MRQAMKMTRGMGLTRIRPGKSVFKGGLFRSIALALGKEYLRTGEHAPERTRLAGGSLAQTPRSGPRYHPAKTF